MRAIRGIFLSGTTALLGLLRELREKEEAIHKTVDITLDVIRRGTAIQTVEGSIDGTKQQKKQVVGI